MATVPGAPAAVVGRARAGRHQARAGATSSSPGCSATTPQGRGTKQTMSRTMLPRAVAAGADDPPRLPGAAAARAGATAIVGARCRRTHPGGGVERADDRGRPRLRVRRRRPDARPCSSAAASAATSATGLKMHPTIKIAARFPHPLDHGDVPMHRVTEFAPFLAIGGSASRRGHVAMALAETGAPYDDALADWENVVVYYAAIRSDGSGRVRRPPRPARRRSSPTRSPRPTSAAWPAASSTSASCCSPPAPPSCTRRSWAAPVVRRLDDLGAWWDAGRPGPAPTS